MVTDQEPRYRLVDADGNVVGSLFAEADGTLKLQEGTSGNDNEVSLTTQGALEVEQADIGNLQIRTQTVTVADDSVEELTAKINGDAVDGQIEVYTINGGSAAFLSNFDFLGTMGLLPQATNQGSTDLTTTDGPDGNFNYSRFENIFQIENRFGDPRDFLVVFKDK